MKYDLIDCAVFVSMELFVMFCEYLIKNWMGSNGFRLWKTIREQPFSLKIGPDFLKIDLFRLKSNLTIFGIFCPLFIGS